MALARRHAHTLAAMGAPTDRVRVLRSFDPTTCAADVADPYRGTDHDYERAFTVIDAAMPGLHAYVAGKLKTIAPERFCADANDDGGQR